MCLNSLWRTLSAEPVERKPPRDAVDAKINGTAREIANLNSGKLISHYVI